MSAIDDDPEIETVIGDILDGGERKMLDQTPNNRGMGAAEKTDLRAALVAKGTVLDALDDDTPLRDWLSWKTLADHCGPSRIGRKAAAPCRSRNRG